MALFSMLSVLGALVFAVQPDPWDKANEKAQKDANAIEGFISSPDKISLLLSKDVTLSRAVIWDGEGRRHYPPPDGLIPSRYEVSDDTQRTLVSRQAQVEKISWTPFDTGSTQLLHCRAQPSICIIYDRTSLEKALDLKSGALTGKAHRGHLILFLIAVSCCFAGASFWLKRTQKEPSRQFEIIPERHLAVRDTLEISLTPRDLKLLSKLEERDGAVVTKDELYDAGWGRDYMPNSRSLDQHIINLRKKLDPDKSRPALIETVHGVGYRLLN